MPTLICFALKEEAAPFRKVAARHPGVITLTTGIGRANAEKSMREFLAGGGGGGPGRGGGAARVFEARGDARPTGFGFDLRLRRRIESRFETGRRDF
jgi:hypothetical protein